MENNNEGSRPDNWVDAHPELYPDKELIETIKKNTPKKLEVKHMDFGDDDPDYDNKMQQALGK